MKIIKKIISILIMVILLCYIFGILGSRAEATTYAINKADLYSKGEMVSFTYKGIGVGVEFVVYKKDGVEYPAYCLNRKLVGVTSDSGASVTVNKAVE